jgi:uncharacterized membrane protein required for colicin V production
MTWIDGLALLTFAVAFYCGWRAGVVAEFFDLGSLIIAFALAGMTSGAVAGGLPPTWSLSDSERHLLAFWLMFVVFYALARVIGWFVERSRWQEIPVMRWIGGTGGGLIAVAKVVAALFVISYFALFAQLDPQMRETLRNSPIANAFDKYYPPINDAVVQMSPRLYRPVVRMYMAHHRV